MFDPVTYTILVNGRAREVRSLPAATLLTVLRDNLGLTGTKFNCEQGECGACTVLIDGRAVNSCLVLGVTVSGQQVETIEGLGTGERLDVVQESFVECDAAQCGYCTPGMVMSAKALLATTSSPSRVDIEAALAGNYCRCTGYDSVIQAVERAAARESDR